MLILFRPVPGVLRASAVNLALVRPLRFKTRKLVLFRPDPGVLRASVVNLAQHPSPPSSCRPGPLGGSLPLILLPLLSLIGKLFLANVPYDIL